MWFLLGWSPSRAGRCPASFFGGAVVSYTGSNEPDPVRIPGDGPRQPVPGSPSRPLRSRTPVRMPVARSCRGQVGQAPRARRTSRRTSTRSVMIPSTPRSSSRCISAAESTVQTCTRCPPACASLTRPGVTTRNGPNRSGTCAQGTPRGASAAASPEVAAARSSRTPRGPSEVHSRGPRLAADRPQPALGEGRHADPVQRAGPPDRADERADSRAVLDVDVHPDLRPGAEQVLQARDRLAPADAGAAHSRPRQLGDPARPGRSPGRGSGRGRRAGRRRRWRARRSRGSGTRGRRPARTPPASSPARRPNRLGARTRSAPRGPGTGRSGQRRARAAP